MFASIFERADGVLQRRKIGEEGPGSFKIRRPFDTVLTLMVRCIGCGRRRDERLIAAGTHRLLERADGVPARGTEEGHWVGAEGGTTCEAFDWQDKPEGADGTIRSADPVCLHVTSQGKRSN